ncbi:cysteine desulfurase family protein [Latilactobacillus graminis]|uniref:Aminotransferase class-V family protein n=2 Tax=Latilactobacillus graminis TaxID=60519 RepID=A0AA89KXY6_9LACO|nr:cysteine desulfurase family protein [Latilactobacillus graminis]KRM23868.1 aminotransferase class-V family protein [Latilactobacillus graminis DSM 20719]QFP79757.1 cysteine desulfurase [Latilactobacillus graminis]
MKHIYLDNAATTPMAPEVIATMTEQMQADFGNASSTHYFGRQAHTVLDTSRHTLAQSIHAKDNEIILTSGATESNNTAILQTAKLRAKEGKRIITTAIEHHSVLKPMAYLESQGFDVVYLPVNEQGVIDLNDLKAALTPETILVSIMMGNNEVGSHMPIHEIGELVRESNAWFHTDATQTYGLLDIDVQADNIDLLAVSAHKINGPKQIGFLYVNDAVHLPSFVLGGEQEKKRRAGTENVPAVAGFAKAVELLTPAVKADIQARYAGFRQQLLATLAANDIDFALNAEGADQVGHVVNLWIKGVSTYVLQMNLDLAGFAISGGSACTAGDLEPSHVLIAMYGEDSPRVAESIRISFGHETTSEEVAAFAEALTKIVKRNLAKQVAKG